MAERKHCIRCGHLKETADYPADSNAPDGLGRWCESCMLEQEPDWSIGNLLSGLGLHLPLLAYLSFNVLLAVGEAGAGTRAAVIALTVIGIPWLLWPLSWFAGGGAEDPILPTSHSPGSSSPS